MISAFLQGGLANNLFQMAATIAHSIRNNFDYVIPIEIENPHYRGQQVYKSKNIKYSLSLPPDLQIYEERSLKYQPVPPIDNICLKGYFQSYKYFNDCIDEIRRLFDFKYEQKDGITSIHVRRGDYLKLPYHNAFVGATYFKRAVYAMNSKGFTKFHVISNDMPWCRNYFTERNFHPANSFEFIEGGNEVSDLEHASGCQNQIMSNSAYSLMQHLLNQHPEKICTAPTIWFGDQIKEDTQDLYPPNCILIENIRSEAFEQA